MKKIQSVNEDLMTPAEVASAFRVDPKTVTRWADAGKLGNPVRTPGGHRRYRTTDILAMLNGHIPGGHS